ncbi:hypothetical protein KC366_g19185, partial [Hortaea werneckii]
MEGKKKPGRPMKGTTYKNNWYRKLSTENERLTSALKAAEDEITTLKEQVKLLES